MDSNGDPINAYHFGAGMDSAGRGNFGMDTGQYDDAEEDINGGFFHFGPPSAENGYGYSRYPAFPSAVDVVPAPLKTATALNNYDKAQGIIRTPKSRTTLRHPLHHKLQEPKYQSSSLPLLAMNSHLQSADGLPASNNSRQQLSSNTLSYATPTTSPYNDLHLVANEMNALYETTRPFDQVRDFHQGQLQEHEQIDGPRYPSPPPPIGNNNPYVQQQQQQPQQQAATPESRGEGQVEPKSESDAPSPGRSKPVIKPERQVTKTAGGQFQCDWPNCTEEVKTFSRKCEWSKHMDKHDRPYKCPASGCEKLPGFTYSGGLLRHEREVHNKHGGPRKQLNCPHPNCKRHGGKGFSRQENLNEHLRRVHTAPTPGPITNGATPGIDGSMEEVQDQVNEAQTGQKRKRGPENDEDDIREELKRLQRENLELREELERSRAVQESQESIQADMQRQLHHLQAAMHLQPRMQQAPAPAANMV